MITTIRIVKAGFDPNEDEICMSRCEAVYGTCPGSSFLTLQLVVITTWVYWGLVECSTGILAACLPTLSFLTSSVMMQRPWETLASAFGTRPRSSRGRHNGVSETSQGEDESWYKAGNQGVVHADSKPREEAYEMGNRQPV